MRKQKSFQDSIIISRRLVMPDQTNPHGTLFGGTLLSWIDKAAFMTAQRHAGIAQVVTVQIEKVNFLSSLAVGDHALITSRLIGVGTSSMRIFVSVEREDAFSGETTEVGSAYLVFVALGGNSLPAEVPLLSLEPGCGFVSVGNAGHADKKNGPDSLFEQTDPEPFAPLPLG